MDKIKPCPFCGNEIADVDDWETYAQVTCGMCDAAGPCCNDVEEAVERWNAVPRKGDAEMEKKSCKYQVQATPFDTGPKKCMSCKYSYVYGDDECAMYYCGREIGNPEGYVCDKWAGVNDTEDVKASVSTPLTPSDFEVTEVCPHCESEIMMQWDVYTHGYKAYCPHCGGRLMLCTACHDDNGGSCDYDSETDTCRYNRVEIDPVTPSNLMGLDTDTITKIAWETNLEENVRQLLEEASELIVACCKYLRAIGSGQPTPVTEDQALTMIGEELADVHIVGEVLMQQSETIKLEFGINKIDKQKRWKERLEHTS